MIIDFLLLYSVKGLFNLIQDKSLFSLSIISGRLSPELALLLVFAKLTAEPLIRITFYNFFHL